VLLHGIAGVISAECDSHLGRQGSHWPATDMGLDRYVTTFA
jgi:hypothetical protein